MQVTVLVRPEVASAILGRKSADATARDLLDAARDLGVRLQPLHPHVADPRLASYFIAEVPAGATAQQVIDGLGKCKAVEAAYVKPQDAIP